MLSHHAVYNSLEHDCRSGRLVYFLRVVNQFNQTVDKQLVIEENMLKFPNDLIILFEEISLSNCISQPFKPNMLYCTRNL